MSKTREDFNERKRKKKPFSAKPAPVYQCSEIRSYNLLVHAVHTTTFAGMSTQHVLRNFLNKLGTMQRGET